MKNRFENAAVNSAGQYVKKIIKLIFFFLLLCLAYFWLSYRAVSPCFAQSAATPQEQSAKQNPANSVSKSVKKFIKWVDFNASYEIISKAYQTDLSLKAADITDVGICELLAFVSLKNGNSFSYQRDARVLDKLAAEIKGGSRASLDRYAENTYFKHYLEGYYAIFDGIVGEYQNSKGETVYGLKGYFPLARGFWFNHYDDFGNSRNYGFKRRHLGHDMYGSIGTPIIAVEGGTITELGWNQYGGWRIGIRSTDTKRYYYYAHLRSKRPFPANLKKGDTVAAGQVIGYLGVTGYSRKEGVNMKTKPHMHFGLQLIFDPSQEDGNGEIWINCYALVRFLAKNKMSVVKNPETGEYTASAMR